ncbi:MAG: hypothetical protein O3A00_23135 [Planctomycetota bacterium]|nr:hypothetical protein [Planctomycetota bacterium]
METIERDYSSKGVKFFYIYKALAHPEQNGFIAPHTLKERLMHVAEAKKQLGTRFQWICDTIENDLKHALGNAPNSEFLVDPDGKIVVSRPWSRPAELRQDLEKIFGKVDKPTTVADLNMKPVAPPKTAPKGIVPRIELPGRLSPVIVKPLGDSDDPFYVKLRAENGSGKLYLGFFLDPLYKVHWNNQVKPMSFEITAPQGVRIETLTGNGPKVAEPADADPREFLIAYSGQSREPIKLTFKYFACDDAETFCKPMTQHYEITLERDSDGGSRRSFGGGQGGRPGQRPPGDGGQAARFAEMVKRMDVNADGKITKSEARGPFAQRFDSLDTNKDGVIDKDEQAVMATRFGGGRPGGGPPQPGRRPGAGRPTGADFFKQFDRNKDGKIVKDELPEQMQDRWSRMDSNKDGVLDEMEQKAVLERISQSGQQRPPGAGTRPPRPKTTRKE